MGGRRTQKKSDTPWQFHCIEEWLISGLFLSKPAGLIDWRHQGNSVFLPSPPMGEKVRVRGNLIFSDPD